jgi:hypothetical protein
MHKLNYAEAGVYHRHDVRRVMWALAVTVALSAVSAVVVLIGAWEEPYYGERRIHQGPTQVGLASGLIAFWLVWIVVLLVLLRMSALRFIWFAFVLWSVVCIYYLAECPMGYMEDIARWKA